jgi:signal transduction histidine kinase
MFQGLRGRLLLSYVIVMEIILLLFGLGVYSFFCRRLYTQNEQLDQNLWTLAQVVSPYFREVQVYGNRYFQQVDKLPWRDRFNQEQQNIEWFDAQGKRLMSQGALKLDFKPQPGFMTFKRQGSSKPYEIRTVTFSIYKKNAIANTSSLEGYIRVSQATEDLDLIQNQLLWGLGIGIFMSVGVVCLGGFWLTQKAVEPAEQSYKQLQQFTADASHEFRGPLTAIKLSVDVIQKHPERIHPKDARKLAAIASATEQMSLLTEDLLFLARTDTDLSTPTSQWISLSLNQILQELVDLLDSLAYNKDLTLLYQELAKVSVMGDRGQLTRLFSNLLQNAIQYTPAGGKVILRLEQQNHQALISIEDTGIGIASEDLPLIFDRFWRADKARSRREGGTGLGLAIAQAIAQSHRGKITVSSQVGTGTCFQVCLPLIPG